MRAFDIIFNQIKELIQIKKRSERANIASLRKACREIKQMIKESK